MDISDGTEIEYNTVGELTMFDHYKELTFVEQMESSVTTTVSISPSHIVVKRTGEVTMDQEFIVGQLTNMHLITNFGLEVTMATETSLIQVEENELTVIYETNVGDTSKRYHRMNIKYQ